MYLAHVVLALSQDRAAAHFGRNRATVGNACQVVEDLRDDREVDALLDELEESLRALPAPGRMAAPLLEGRR
jgi:chromosomal replication initiation ATPase DnaA